MIERPRFITSVLSGLIGVWLLPSLAQAAPPPDPAATKSAAQPAAPTPTPSAAPAPAAAPSTPGTTSEAEAATPSPEVMAEAKQRFDRGYELYEEGEYPLALIEFNRAYELVPNYRVLYNIGQVCIQLGQYANARRALESYVEKGGDSLAPERKTAVKKDLEMLGRRTAYVTVSSNIEGAEILIDEALVGKTPLGSAVLVDAGVHRVTLRRGGYQQKTSNVTLAGGDEQALTVTLEVQQEQKETIVVREREVDNSQTWMIAGWVTTGALATGAIITGFLGKSEANELKQLRKADARDYVPVPGGNSALPGRIDDTKSHASTLFLASDVMSGAALIVGGLSLWVTLNPPGPERAGPSDNPPPKAPEPVQVGYADGQLQLRGSF
jgi:PEGA domain-containing protein